MVPPGILRKRDTDTRLFLVLQNYTQNLNGAVIPSFF